MGAVNISNCNIPSALLTYYYPYFSPTSRLPRNSAKGLEFASPFSLRVYDDQTLPTDVIVDTIPEV